MALADQSGSTVVADSTEPALVESAVERKIVYTAEVDVVVEDFDEVPTQVKQLAAQYGGYIAKSNIRGRPGSPRSGQWSIRVSVASYEDFLAAARQIGETRSVRTDSEDVTAEFYDVEARIRNKREEENRLRKHLEDSTGKLEEILDVEREISRVRGEIEQMEGRMRLLKDLTSLTTIHLTVEEIKDYTPEGDPSYGTRVRRALLGSISALARTVQAASIALVAALPWLVVLFVIAVMVFVLRLLIRVLFRRSCERRAT
jgi:hypothetical protein